MDHPLNALDVIAMRISLVIIMVWVDMTIALAIGVPLSKDASP